MKENLFRDIDKTIICYQLNKERDQIMNQTLLKTINTQVILNYIEHKIFFPVVN